jgi:hypothetical protein
MYKSSVESVKQIYFTARLLGICGLLPFSLFGVLWKMPLKSIHVCSFVVIVGLVDIVVDQYGLLLIYAWCRLFGGRRTI